MPERKIEALDFNGEIIYVEVTEVAQEGPDGDGDYEDTSPESDLVQSGERARRTISALAATIRQALDKAEPAEWTLEIHLGFKGKAGIPFITEGEANGAVKVTAKWKRS
jgi:hypothetical protein